MLSALGLVAVLSTLGGAPAGADLLLASEPSAGAVVTEPPTSIDLDLADPTAAVDVRLLDQSGAVLAVRSAGPDGVVDVDVPGVADHVGDVVVAWESAELEAQGAFRFTVDPTGQGTVVVSRSAESATDSLRLSRVFAALIAGSAVLVGAALVTRRSRVPLGLWAGVGVLASLTGLALAGVAADGGPADALSGDALVDGVRDGLLWLAPIAAIALLVVIASARWVSTLFVGVATATGLAASAWLMVSGADLGGTDPAFAERLVDDAGTIELVLEPAQAGVNEVHLYGFGPGGGLSVLSDARMWATHLDADVGPLAVPLVRAGSNHFLTYSAVLPFDGRWELTVSGVTAEGDEVRVSTEVQL